MQPRGRHRSEPIRFLWCLDRSRGSSKCLHQPRQTLPRCPHRRPSKGYTHKRGKPPRIERAAVCHFHIHLHNAKDAAAMSTRAIHCQRIGAGLMRSLARSLREWWAMALSSWAWLSLPLRASFTAPPPAPHPHPCAAGFPGSLRASDPRCSPRSQAARRAVRAASAPIAGRGR